MQRTLLSLCCFLAMVSALCAQSDDGKSAAQLAEEYVKLRDPARVDDLKRFPLTEAIPAYYKLRRKAWERSVGDRAEILMMTTPGWDKWFVDQLWSSLPASLYYPSLVLKKGDPALDDPDRLERLRKAAELVGSARAEAKELIYYLGGLRDPKVIRILGPIMLLDGETVFGGDVMDTPPSDLAEESLFDMDIYGFPDFQPTEAKRQWWLKSKDLTDAQWWDLLRKGAEQRAKERKRFTPEGVQNPPSRPPPAPVTPPPVLVPKSITPVPLPRIKSQSSISTPRRQPQVPQLASEA